MHKGGEHIKMEKQTQRVYLSNNQIALKVDAFGAFRVTVLKDGKTLSWRTRRGRELFAYLFDIGGKAIGRQKLIETLWQDEIPEKAVAMLHNMIYNIRKELSAYGLESILQYENKQYRLRTDEMLCELETIKALARMVEEKNSAQLRKTYQSFLTYWGRYLEDIDSLWVEEKRQYYDEIYKKGCFMLAKEFETEQDYDTSVVFCKNILSVEPYCEKAMEEMLCLLGKKREWDKMKNYYERFTKILQNDLGITPCKELKAVYYAHFTK